MDTMQIMMMCAIGFVILAFIATLIFILQPEHLKSSSSIFKKKKKQPVVQRSGSASTTAGQNSATIETVSTSLDTLAMKPILKSYELESFNKINSALRNKDVIVFPRILFSDFIGIQKIVANKDNEFFGILPYMRADFLICSSHNCRPLCIVRDKKIPIENAYKSYMENIAKKMNIHFIEVDGITDFSIAEIYKILQQ